ncbi:MAG TPA: type VI secretion system contractile sheath small subunit, partial [Gemmataceae bacterium]|nr:type VI secretion system contractile sheath small subunit [Gemmataceae bacterium]
AESLQHKLDRVRRPRVQITYDVETNGAMQKVELPFVVGVLADLSGQPKDPLRPLKERKVVTIDRDNFNDVLTRAGARVAMKVANKLTGQDDSKLAVELNFKTMDDFDPARVAEQVGPLRELLEMRQKLTQLLSKMEGNDKLEQLLAEVMAHTDKAQALARQMGLEAPAAPAAAAPVAKKEEAPAPAAEGGMDPELAALLNQGSAPAGDAPAAPAGGMDPDLEEMLKQMGGDSGS